MKTIIGILIAVALSVGVARAITTGEVCEKLGFNVTDHICNRCVSQQWPLASQCANNCVSRPDFNDCVRGCSERFEDKVLLCVANTASR